MPFFADRVSFSVDCLPEPKPAARVFTDPRSGKIRSSRSRSADPWLRAVRAAAERVLEARGIADRPLFPPDVPLVLEVAYFLPRPARHFGRRGLRPSALPWPTRKPDLSNLTKGLEDALADWPRGATPLLYAGDQQVVEHVSTKRYADDRGPGAEIVVRAIRWAPDERDR